MGSGHAAAAAQQRSSTAADVAACAHRLGLAPGAAQAGPGLPVHAPGGGDGRAALLGSPLLDVHSRRLAFHIPPQQAEAIGGGGPIPCNCYPIKRIPVGASKIPSSVLSKRLLGSLRTQCTVYSDVLVASHTQRSKDCLASGRSLSELLTISQALRV